MKIVLNSWPLFYFIKQKRPLVYKQSLKTKVLNFQVSLARNRFSPHPLALHSYLPSLLIPALAGTEANAKSTLYKVAFPGNFSYLWLTNGKAAEILRFYKIKSFFASHEAPLAFVKGKGSLGIRAFPFGEHRGPVKPRLARFAFPDALGVHRRGRRESQGPLLCLVRNKRKNKTTKVKTKTKGRDSNPDQEVQDKRSKIFSFIQRKKEIKEKILMDNFWNISFDKGRLKNLVSWFLKNYGEKKTIQLLENLKEIGFGYATKAGVSLGIDDLKIPPKKKEAIYLAEKNTFDGFRQSQRGEITEVERFQRFIDTWHQTSETLKNEVVKHFEATDLLNPVYIMAFSGARGNLSQVRQLVGMRGLMSDAQGQILDFPIRSNFREGLTLTEYIISSYGARKGIVDTALRTANAGYLTRRLVDVAQHVIVSTFDCGSSRGIYVFDMKEGRKTIYAFQNRLTGRVLAANLFVSRSYPLELSPSLPSNVSQRQDIRTKEPKSELTFLRRKKEIIALRNTEISSDLALTISKLTTKALIRSPLTCQNQKQVCQLCYGWSLSHGRLVSIGEAVGVIAAQSIGEPGTQLTMRTFHTGGVFAGGISDQIIAPYEGFVYYPSLIPGICVRTPQGFLAFLTKEKGHLQIRKNSEIDKGELFKIPSYTLLFIKQKEKVTQKQLIAQISSASLNSIQKTNSEQTIPCPMEGEIYSSDLDIIEKTNCFNDKTQETVASGYIWVLAGKTYDFPISTNFFPKSGDFVTKDSIVNQIQWVSTEKVMFHALFSTKKKTADSQNLFPKPAFVQPILSAFPGNFSYAEIRRFYEVKSFVPPLGFAGPWSSRLAFPFVPPVTSYEVPAKPKGGTKGKARRPRVLYSPLYGGNTSYEVKKVKATLYEATGGIPLKGFRLCLGFAETSYEVKSEREVPPPYLSNSNPSLPFRSRRSRLVFPFSPRQRRGKLVIQANESLIESIKIKTILRKKNKPFTSSQEAWLHFLQKKNKLENPLLLQFKNKLKSKKLKRHKRKSFIKSKIKVKTKKNFLLWVKKILNFSFLISSRLKRTKGGTKGKAQVKVRSSNFAFNGCGVFAFSSIEDICKIGHPLKKVTTLDKEKRYKPYFGKTNKAFLFYKRNNANRKKMFSSYPLKKVKIQQKTKTSKEVNQLCLTKPFLQLNLKQISYKKLGYALTLLSFSKKNLGTNHSSFLKKSLYLPFCWEFSHIENSKVLVIPWRSLKSRTTSLEVAETLTSASPWRPFGKNQVHLGRDTLGISRSGRQEGESKTIKAKTQKSKTKSSNKKPKANFFLFKSFKISPLEQKNLFLKTYTKSITSWEPKPHLLGQWFPPSYETKIGGFFKIFQHFYKEEPRFSKTLLNTFFSFSPWSSSLLLQRTPRTFFSQFIGNEEKTKNDSKFFVSYKKKNRHFLFFKNKTVLFKDGLLSKCRYPLDLYCFQNNGLKLQTFLPYRHFRPFFAFSECQRCQNLFRDSGDKSKHQGLWLQQRAQEAKKSKGEKRSNIKNYLPAAIFFKPFLKTKINGFSFSKIIKKTTYTGLVLKFIKSRSSGFLTEKKKEGFSFLYISPYTLATYNTNNLMKKKFLKDKLRKKDKAHFSLKIPFTWNEIQWISEESYFFYAYFFPVSFCSSHSILSPNSTNFTLFSKQNRKTFGPWLSRLNPLALGVRSLPRTRFRQSLGKAGTPLGVFLPLPRTRLPSPSANAKGRQSLREERRGPWLSPSGKARLVDQGQRERRVRPKAKEKAKNTKGKETQEPFFYQVNRQGVKKPFVLKKKGLLKTSFLNRTSLQIKSSLKFSLSSSFTQLLNPYPLANVKSTGTFLEVEKAKGKAKEQTQRVSAVTAGSSWNSRLAFRLPLQRTSRADGKSQGPQGRRPREPSLPSPLVFEPSLPSANAKGVSYKAKKAQKVKNINLAYAFLKNYKKNCLTVKEDKFLIKHVPFKFISPFQKPILFDSRKKAPFFRIFKNTLSLQNDETFFLCSVKQGWIYVTTKKVFNIHQSIIPAGKIFLEDLVFEKHQIYIKSSLLNFPSVSTPLVFAFGSEPIVFKPKKTISNQNERFPVKKLNLQFCYFLQKMDLEILPQNRKLKKTFLKYGFSFSKSFSSLVLLKFFHSVFLNKQKISTKVFSTFPEPDFSFYNIPSCTSEKNPQLRSLVESAKKIIEVKSSFNFQSKKQTENYSQNKIFTQNIKNYKKLEHKKALLCKNFHKQVFHSNIFAEQLFYFSEKSFQILPLIVGANLPSCLTGSFQSALFEEFLSATSLQKNMDQSFKEIPQILNKKKRSSVLIHRISSLFVSQKTNRQRPKASSFYFQNKEDKRPLFNSFELKKFLYCPILSLAFSKKMAFLYNQKLLKLSNSNKSLIPVYLPAMIKNQLGFKNSLKSLLENSKKKTVHFPKHKNEIYFHPNSQIFPNQSLGLTSFYSPLEGELLLSFRDKNRNQESITTLSFIKIDSYKKEQNNVLFLTREDFISYALEKKITRKNQKANAQKTEGLKDVKDKQKRNNFFKVRSQIFLAKNQNKRKNFRQIEKQLLVNFQKSSLFLEQDESLAKSKQENSFLIRPMRFVSSLKNQSLSDGQKEKTLKTNGQKIKRSFELTGLRVGITKPSPKLRLGTFLIYGDCLSLSATVDKAGQIIHLNNKKVTLRYAQPFLLSSHSILHAYHGDFIQKNAALITLPFQTLKSGDIVQGIPKVEQYFEARTTKVGRLFRESLPNLLKALFQRYKAMYSLEKAVQQSMLKIQQILVDGVQRVYRSQGVNIADKHLEIVVRQMTNKVQIISGGQTGLFPGELIDLSLIEHMNYFLVKKIEYEPIILGITRASLEVDSFLSASSFQQTTKVLSKAAIYKRKDFLKGLKENIIVGNLIPGGTGYIIYKSSFNKDTLIFSKKK